MRPLSLKILASPRHRSFLSFASSSPVKTSCPHQTRSRSGNHKFLASFRVAVRQWSGRTESPNVVTTTLDCFFIRRSEINRINRRETGCPPIPVFLAQTTNVAIPGSLNWPCRRMGYHRATPVKAHRGKFPNKMSLTKFDCDLHRRLKNPVGAKRIHALAKQIAEFFTRLFRQFGTRLGYRGKFVAPVKRPAGIDDHAGIRHISLRSFFGHDARIGG